MYTYIYIYIYIYICIYAYTNTHNTTWTIRNRHTVHYAERSKLLEVPGQPGLGERARLNLPYSSSNNFLFSFYGKIPSLYIIKSDYSY